MKREAALTKWGTASRSSIETRSRRLVAGGLIATCTNHQWAAHLALSVRARNARCLLLTHFGRVTLTLHLHAVYLCLLLSHRAATVQEQDSPAPFASSFVHAGGRLRTALSFATLILLLPSISSLHSGARLSVLSSSGFSLVSSPFSLKVPEHCVECKACQRGRTYSAPLE